MFRALAPFLVVLAACSDPVGDPVDTGADTGGPIDGDVTCAEDLRYSLEVRDADGPCASCDGPLQVYVVVENPCGPDREVTPEWGCLIASYGWYRPADDSGMDAFPYCVPPDSFVVPAGGRYAREIHPWLDGAGTYQVYAELGTVPFTIVDATIDWSG